MVVDNILHIMGRGWVLCITGDELTHMDLATGSKVISKDTEFVIRGIERVMYDVGWYSKQVGLVLSPNSLVPESFDIGQKIEITL